MPANLAVVRTLTQSLGAPDRARRRPRRARSQALEAAFAIAVAVGPRRPGGARSTPSCERLERRRRRRCRSSTTPDLRYRNRVWRPEPIARAVMFCLMDVSASMDEDKKDLAKRFFTLLYLFLTRKYGEVDLVFIRHTDDAEEVDEDTFFHDPRSGGTVVYLGAGAGGQDPRASATPRGWNVYAAQASDGDAFGADPGAQRAVPARDAAAGDALLHLPRAGRAASAATSTSTLWAEYERVAEATDNFAMRRAIAARARSIRCSATCSARNRSEADMSAHLARRRLGLRPARALRRRDRAKSAAEFGLDTYPNQIEIITSEQMLDAYASSGLPIGYPHWSYGKEFIRNEQAYRRGMQGLAYEIVINSDPVHRVPDGGEHDDDAGAGHRARVLRPQLVLQGQSPVPAVDRGRRHPRLPRVRAPLRDGVRGAPRRGGGRGSARRLPCADGARRRSLSAARGR